MGLFDFLSGDKRLIDKRPQTAAPLDPNNLTSVVMHDRGGTYQGNSPYHIEVLPDGRIVNSWGDDQKAPHAFKMNPESIGVAYGGAVGSKPTPEAQQSIDFVLQGIREQRPDLKFQSHGQAYEATKGTAHQASKLGRGLDEASWRDDVQFAVPAPKLVRDTTGAFEGSPSAAGGKKMNREDDTFYPTQSPNLVARTLADIDQRVTRQTDPVTGNSYIAGLADKYPAASDQMGLLQGLQAANAQSMPKPKPPSGWELAGSGLQILGGVVDSGITGRRDLFNNMQAAVQGRTDARSEQQRKLDEMMATNAQAINQEGYKVASESLTDKRIKKETARRQAGAVLALSMDANGNPTPAAIRQAAEIAARAGDTAYEKHFNDMLQGSSPSGAAPTSPTPDQIASEAGGVTGAGFGAVDPSDLAAPQAAPAAAAQAPGGDMPTRQYVEDAKSEVDHLQGVLTGLVPGKDDALIKPTEERLKAAQERAAKFENTYAEEDAKSLFKQRADRDKEALAAPEALQSYTTARQFKERGIDLAKRLVSRSEDGKLTLSPGAAASTGRSLWGWGPNNADLPNVFDSSAKGWADIVSLQNFTNADGLIQLKKEAGGVGSVTEKEWPLMAARLSSLNREMLATDPEQVAQTIYKFQDLMQRQQDNIDRFMQRKYGNGEWTDRLSAREAEMGGGGQRTSDQSMQGSPPIDDGVVRDAAQKKQILQSKWSQTEIGGVMALPNGRRIVKTGPGPRDYRDYVEGQERGDFGDMDPYQIAP